MVRPTVTEKYTSHPCARAPTEEETQPRAHGGIVRRAGPLFMPETRPPNNPINRSGAEVDTSACRAALAVTTWSPTRGLPPPPHPAPGHTALDPRPIPSVGRKRPPWMNRIKNGVLGLSPKDLRTDPHQVIASTQRCTVVATDLPELLRRSSPHLASPDQDEPPRGRQRVRPEIALTRQRCCWPCADGVPWDSTTGLQPR